MVFALENTTPRLNECRAFVDPFFTRANIDSMLPVIQTTVDDCIKQLKAHGGKEPIDFIENFALRVPSQVTYSITAKSLSTG